MDLTGIMCDDVDWIHVAQDRDTFRPSGSVNDGEFLD
jgi:hypothetical protein